MPRISQVRPQQTSSRRLVSLCAASGTTASAWICPCPSRDRSTANLLSRLLLSSLRGGSGDAFSNGFTGSVTDELTTFGKLPRHK